METEPVVIYEALNPLEAEVVKGRLESEGIPAIVRSDATGTIFGLAVGGLAKAEVLVPEPLAERALQLLAEDVTDPDVGDDDGIGEDVVDEELAGDEEA